MTTAEPRGGGDLIKSLRQSLASDLNESLRRSLAGDEIHVNEDYLEGLTREQRFAYEWGFREAIYQFREAICQIEKHLESNGE